MESNRKCKDSLVKPRYWTDLPTSNRFFPLQGCLDFKNPLQHPHPGRHLEKTSGTGVPSKSLLQKWIVPTVTGLLWPGSERKKLAPQDHQQFLAAWNQEVVGASPRWPALILVARKKRRKRATTSASPAQGSTLSVMKISLRSADPVCLKGWRGHE